ncbi:GNAT family N-acetyltransferase [Microbacterium invictum]|uniref:GNAT superfamily N-acetyltransferase n=1 Tax=Microbacterium invictum TaxID=515415 RepID=A0AA40SNP7_9MICO|nr:MULTISPECIES: GNAT family N-acetyltransferase [Microbacterium]MBB4139455.1 GNAT superfamily N-acetyltransferase [Microbacterium invictum]
MSEIRIREASPSRFADIEHSLTGGGDGASCMCQWWTLTNAEWNDTDADQRRELLRDEVDAGPPPGLIAYVDGEAAGWVRVAPRTAQGRIPRMRIIKGSNEPLDDDSVWAVTCFVVRREYRRQGLNAALLTAAVDFARQHGARVVEGYPFDLAVKKSSANSLFHGTLSTFVDAGFSEVARTAPHQPIVALALAET